MRISKKLFFALMAGWQLFQCSTKKEIYYKPQIEGDWWTIATNPDLGRYTSPKQQPVDFGIWQARDGSWQLWSCIRHTKCGGNTRLFYGWEAQHLTDSLWTPKGIMMEADTLVGEHFGGLQAPHVILKDDIYFMIYGGWDQLCLASSEDGKTFTRVINDEGTTEIFTGPFDNSRDAMTLMIKGKYHCYYTGHIIGKTTENIKAAIFCRTSTDLLNWSDPVMVSGGGSVADLDSWGGGDAECPFVVHVGDKYVLFRNVEYGMNNLNVQYCSTDPLNFGIDTDSLMVGQLSIAAPEIIQYEGQYYIASLKQTLDGIKLARLRFVEKN
jgi:hypothetical protein